MSKNHYQFIPELEFPCGEVYNYGMSNKEHFRKDRGLLGFSGFVLPYRYTKILNDQILLDIVSYNNATPLFTRGQFYVLTEEYPTHTDPFRDCSLNFVLSGDAETRWNDGTICEYVPHMATLFNTQIPHKVSAPEGDEPRVAVSFTVSINYHRFVNLYKNDMLFTDHPVIYQRESIIPE